MISFTGILNCRISFVWRIFFFLYRTCGEFYKKKRKMKVLILFARVFIFFHGKLNVKIENVNGFFKSSEA